MHRGERKGQYAQRCAVIAGLALLTAPAWGQQPSTKNGEWPSYTGDMQGSRYSPLDQINASNFNKLEVAWRFKTDNLGPRPEYKLEGTPLMVKGVIYTTAGTRRSVIALDAKTGELMWAYSLREGNRAAIAPRQLSGRGVSYWTDGKGDDRVIFVTTGYRLVALNAHTGQPIQWLREGRHGGSEGRHGDRHGPADRSGNRRDRPALNAPGGEGHRDRRLVVQRGHDGGDAQQYQGAGARFRRPHRKTYCGPSTPFLAPASSATRPGKTVPGPPTATPACGPR